MRRALIGRKKGMMQVIADDGTIIPVTICELGPCTVIQKKTPQKDGYSALKVGFLPTKEHRLAKPQIIDFKKRNLSPMKVVREIDLFDDSLDVGSVITCDIFKENDIVDVTGVSKGRGFQGVIKRHGFAGGRASHGSTFHRAPGSIGANTFPAEVWKGKRMPGRHGNKTVTVKNLRVVKVFKDKNIVLISGSIPGTVNSIIKVRAK